MGAPFRTRADEKTEVLSRMKHRDALAGNADAQPRILVLPVRSKADAIVVNGQLQHSSHHCSGNPYISPARPG